MAHQDHRIRIYLEASVTDGWTEDDASVYSGNSPGAAWTDLDLSSYVGSAYSHVRIRVENTGSGDVNLTFRPKGLSINPLTDVDYAQGVWRVKLSTTAKFGVVDLPTGQDGVVQWYDSAGTESVDLTLIGHVTGPAVPAISGESPTGSAEDPDVIASFVSEDADGDISASGIDLEFLDPDSVTHDVIVAGAWQAGYSGTIAANGGGGYDIDVTGHPLFKVGLWRATATVTDDSGMSRSSTWTWTVSAAGGITAEMISPGKTVTGEAIERVILRVLSDWGLDIGTLDLAMSPSVGETMSVIAAGVVQPGWAAILIELDDIGYGPRHLDIMVTGWPSLPNGHRVDWSLTITDSVGATL